METANCRLCKNLVISTGVGYDTATNTVSISIPSRNYGNGEHICIVVAQNIAPTTPIGALVQIATNGTTFPLIKCCGNQMTAREIRTRTKYKTIVQTNTTSGVFKLTGKVCACGYGENLDALPNLGA